MRFDAIRLSGLGPFKAPVELDLTAIPGRLIAVTGGNGQGKSTLLELLAGSLHRVTPTRGTIASLATSRDAYVETRFTNGSPWTLRHSVDSVSGAGDSLVLDADGRSAFDSAKRRAFDQWSAKHLPSKDLLFACSFAAQGSRGFLGMNAGERKAVILRAIGIERLEALAKLAREHMAAARLETVRLRAQIDSIPTADQSALIMDLHDAEKTLAAAGEAVKRAKAQEERARAYAAAAPQIEPLRRLLADLQEWRANNALILVEAEKIRSAVELVDGAVDVVRNLEAELALDEKASFEASTKASNILRLREANEEQRRGIERRIREAEALLEQRGAVEAAEVEVARLRTAIAAAEAGAAEHRQKANALRVEIAAKSSGRIAGLRDALKGIAASTRADSKPRANAALQADDAAVALASTGPAEAAREDRAHDDLLVDVAGYRADLVAVERVAARRAGLEQAERTLAAAQDELATNLVAHVKLQADRDAARRDLAVADAAAAEARKLLAEARATAERLTLLARRGPALEKAEERITELDVQIHDAAARLASLEAVPVEDDRDYVTPAETALAACRARRERAALALEQAKTDSDRRAGIQVELARAEEELSDWTRLAEDLGRDGLQSAEVDCAAPELTELTNDLLHSCIGPRWTVAIEAQRLSADGKEQLAGMEVTVLDAEAGREGAGETFSGGEQVLLQEAISLALTMVACRRSGAVRPTIIRDESAAALSPTNSRLWLGMLRRAADLIDAGQVLFVSHQPDIASLADARIVVADGRVTVQ